MPHVVLVEDDKFLSDLISRKFTSENISFTHCTDGETALEKIKNEKPDVIVLDIMLPGIDGFQVLDTLKKDNITKDIPVIVLTNLSQEEDRKKSMELGAERFFIKATIDVQEIVQEVKSLVEKSK